MRDSIIIHTFVSKETESYFLYMRDCYLAKSSSSIEFCLYTFDQSVKDNFLNYEVILLTDTTPDAVPAFAKFGYKHYITIKSALDNFKDAMINIIADTDTVAIADRWDELIKNALVGKYCVGASYFTKWHHRDYPCFIWLAFNKNCGKDYDINQPFPNGDNIYKFLTEEDMAFFNHKIYDDTHSAQTDYILKKCNVENLYKSVIIADLGWDFPQFLVSNNLKYSIFDNVSNFHWGHVFLNGNMKFPHVEYHLNGVALIAHQESGTVRPFRKCIASSEFYDEYEKYLKENENNNSHICF